MTRINLLPWRAMQRETLKKQFFTTLILGAFITFIILLLIHFSMTHTINRHKNKNIALKTQITQLGKQLDKKITLKKQETQLLSQIKNIQLLQEHLSNGSH